MNEELLWNQLQEIHGRQQKGGIISEEKSKLFNDWVVKSYALTPIGKLEIHDWRHPNNILFSLSSPALPHQINLCRVRHKNANKNLGICIKQQTLKKIPVPGMEKPLRSIGSSFILLPNTLNDFQEQRLLQLEFCLSYASVYIIRESWGKNLCSLPKVDNQIKSVLNAWSEPWLQLSNLCIKCRDFLSDAELQQMPRSWDWLDAIAQEHRQSVLKFITSEEVLVSTSKDEEAKAIRDFADFLEDGGANAGSSFEQPQTYRLYSIATNLADKADTFRSDYWQQYISSLRQWAATIKKNSHIIAIHCDRGKTKRERRGRG
ncbi:hypothetical protein F7734_43210 [Scytonema sp. UIC 10036]|uniref:hypothetical protein n=1 Tax=Scytonema sp. UIC 10036 TaxID=2304196 RepID=UPI0012DA0FD1|nr:hypothetical protein [Scytonema sp. UIC 10036]MUG98743.1 hypothetical protein [Scytonema sp. UIC 10036]